MDGLSEKAAAISGGVTGAVLHLILGLLVFGTPGTMMGAYATRYYGMMQLGYSGLAFVGWIVSILVGAVVGGFVGWLVAVSYNWGLKRK